MRTRSLLRGPLLLLAILAGVLVAPSGVAAQGAEREARELFQAGNEALSTGRFAEARDLFRRSLDITPNAGTAFNLAVALRGTGQTLEALQIFEALLEGEFGRLSRAQRRETERLRREVEAEIAVLHITVRGADDIEVRVDGQRIASAADGEIVEHRVDPGVRVVTVSAPRRVTQERRVDLERGSSVELEVELELTEDARLGTLIVEAVDPDDVLEIVGVARGTGTLRRQLEPGEYEVQVDGPAGYRESVVDLEAGTTLRVRLEADDGGLWSSPWLWTGVGAVVVGLAVGAFFVFGEREEDPISDPVYGVIQTLRGP